MTVISWHQGGQSQHWPTAHCLEWSQCISRVETALRWWVRCWSPTILCAFHAKEMSKELSHTLDGCSLHLVRLGRFQIQGVAILLRLWSCWPTSSVSRLRSRWNHIFSVTSHVTEREIRMSCKRVNVASSSPSRYVFQSHMTIGTLTSMTVSFAASSEQSASFRNKSY